MLRSGVYTTVSSRSSSVMLLSTTATMLLLLSSCLWIIFYTQLDTKISVTWQTCQTFGNSPMR